MCVAEARVEAHTDAVGGIRPLALEVLCRGDDRDSVDGAARQQFGDQPEREGRLACAGRCGDEEVAGFALEVDLEGLGLPGAQAVRCTAGRPAGEGR